MDSTQTQKLTKLVGDELVSRLGDGYLAFTILEVTPALDRREMDITVHVVGRENITLSISLDKFREEVL